MSDLVKKIEMLATSPEASNWILVIDGAGWKKRSMDLRRLLAITREKRMAIYTLKQWAELNQPASLQA